MIFLWPLNKQKIVFGVAFIIVMFSVLLTGFNRSGRGQTPAVVFQKAREAYLKEDYGKFVSYLSKRSRQKLKVDYRSFRREKELHKLVIEKVGKYHRNLSRIKAHEYLALANHIRILGNLPYKLYERFGESVNFKYMDVSEVHLYEYHAKIRFRNNPVVITMEREGRYWKVLYPEKYNF
ncbi:hypothetical protein ACFL56_03210 [Candidatus Margulisiibacteriota bacterium]